MHSVTLMIVRRRCSTARSSHRAPAPGPVPQDQRLQVAHAALQELALLLDDALGHLDDRPAPLLDGPDQPLRAPELLTDELLRLRVPQHLLCEPLVDVTAL